MPRGQVNKMSQEEFLKAIRAESEALAKSAQLLKEIAEFSSRAPEFGNTLLSATKKFLEEDSKNANKAVRRIYDAVALRARTYHMEQLELLKNGLRLAPNKKDEDADLDEAAE